MALKKSELYASLWQSCDELHGDMDASQYKDYVLVLLFIKYVSDKYAGIPYVPIAMSALLDEIIAARKAKAIEYEEYLKCIAQLAKNVEAGQAEDLPVQLNTPGRRALYNNLKQGRTSLGNANVAADPMASYKNAPNDSILKLAVKIDDTVKRTRPDGWRGVQARERVIKAALYGILQSETEVERIFLIIKQQKEY